MKTESIFGAFGNLDLNEWVHFFLFIYLKACYQAPEKPHDYDQIYKADKEKVKQSHGDPDLRLKL